MLHLKLFIVAAASTLFVFACSNGAKQPYSIQNSKAYEASLFRQNCAICHGPEGEGKTLDSGLQVPNLRHPPYKYKTEGEIYDHIAKGGNGMVPFAGQLSAREIGMMTQFVVNDLREKQ
ncbi:MAG TPA: cytochrome c [Pyrinomonadaceae bacterium]|nr:cytochrome c [Pyrinomonadaceae bacterium]